MDGIAIGRCRLCAEPFTVALRVGQRVEQVCDICKEAIEFKLGEQRVLDSIKVGYLSPHE